MTPHETPDWLLALSLVVYATVLIGLLVAVARLLA